MATSYSTDRTAWCMEQALHLRTARWDRIDKENVAAEIERLQREDEATLNERIRILLTALLRWAYQADLRSPGLSSTIMSQRIEIDRILDDSASLRPLAAASIINVYPEAKRLAVIESGLFDESFPEGLPFLPSEVLDWAFMPDPFGDDSVPNGNILSKPGTTKRVPP